MRVLVQRCGDLADLASPGREPTERLGDIDARIELVHEFLGAPAHLVEVYDEPFLGDVVEAQVFRDREVRALGEFLMDDAHARSEGVIERAGQQLAAFQGHASRVLLVQARDDLAQRGFTRAVLTHQGVHLAGQERHADIAQRLGNPERLADAACDKDRLAMVGVILHRAISSSSRRTHRHSLR